MDKKGFKLTDISVDGMKTVYVMLVLLCVAGVMQYISIDKEKFPEIEFPYYSIVSVYPGASPEDIENLITVPIEKEIKGIDNIKSVVTKSMQDVGIMLVEFEVGADGIVIAQDIRDALDTAIQELPSDMEDEPELKTLDMSQMPMINISLSGDASLVQLKEYAEDLQDIIEGFDEITRVDIVGALDRQIQINVDYYKLLALGLSFEEIANAVAMENMTISGGLVDFDGMKRAMKVTGEFETPKDIEGIQIRNGIYIKDIAEIVDGFEDRESYARLNQEPCVLLDVIRKSGKSLIGATDKVMVALEEYQENMPESVTVSITGDQSVDTKNSVNNLFNTVIFGFVVVVIVLMFFMGIKNAFFVGIAIPISIVLAFLTLPMLDFTVNMVVLMAFVLVLGIVVDNSIVVVENIYRHYMDSEDGDISRSTKIAVSEVAMPIFTGTLTTIAPFFPLIFWPGIMGNFMMFIPVTLIVTLAISMLVAYVVNPVFAVSFMNKTNLAKQPIKMKSVIVFTAVGVGTFIVGHLLNLDIIANVALITTVVYLVMKFILSKLIVLFQEKVVPNMISWYRKRLEWLMKGIRPWFIIVGIILFSIFAMFIVSVMPPKVSFIPGGEPNDIYLYVSMPSGTSLDKTSEICEDLESRAMIIIGKDNPDLDYMLTNVGVNAGREDIDNVPQNKLAKITIGFVEFQYREGESTLSFLNKIREDLRITPIPGVDIRVDQDAKGPPTGDPISIEISGEDYKTLTDISYKVLDLVKNSGVEGIEDLKSDLDISNPEIIVNIDRQKANKHGIRPAMVGGTLRTAIYGTEISRYREGEDDYPINLRLEKQYRDNTNTLMNLKVGKIPLASIATLEPGNTYGSVKRSSFSKAITLSSDVLDGYNANQIIAELKPMLKELDIKDGYKVEFKGEQEDQKEVTDFLSMALLAGIMLIFVVLMFQFNSISKSLMILIQIIFSLVGVLLGFSLSGQEVSIMMTGMGIIAVAGIVVKNAIILVDCTDSQLASGHNVFESVVNAGGLRLTPVLLTAASTIFGLLPLAIGMNFDFMGLFTNLDPNIYFGGDSAAFWAPLAWTIIFGLAFSTILTLLVVPALYTLVFRRKEKAGKL